MYNSKFELIVVANLHKGTAQLANMKSSVSAITSNLDSGIHHYRRRAANLPSTTSNDIYTTIVSDSKDNKYKKTNKNSGNDLMGFCANIENANDLVLRIPGHYLCLIYTFIVLIFVVSIIAIVRIVYVPTNTSEHHIQNDLVSIETKQKSHANNLVPQSPTNDNNKNNKNDNNNKKNTVLNAIDFENFVSDPVPVFIPEYWTIFVSMYSFRNDKSCVSTIQSLLLNATFADRIHIGIYEEKENDLIGCIQFKQKCNDLQIKHQLYSQYLHETGTINNNNNDFDDTRIINFKNFDFLNDILPLSILSKQDISKLDILEIDENRKESIYKFTNLEYLYFNRICTNMENVEIDSNDWSYSQGDSFGKYQSEEFFDDETFVLSIDANFMFVQGWDILLIEEWAATNNEFAILTTYPKNIHSYVTTHSYDYMPVLCNTYFLDWSLRFMVQNNIGSIKNRYHPVLSTLYSQSFNFGKGHRLSMVRNDPYYDSLIDGVEFDMGIRLFTFGYDFYAPHMFMLWNIDENYDPKSKKQEFRKIWQYKWKEKIHSMVRSTHRLRQKLQMKEIIEQDPESDDFDKRDMQLFGMGDIRTIDQYLAFAGIDLKNRNVITKCPDIRQGFLQRVPIINKFTHDDITLLRKQEIRKNQDHA